MHLILDQGVGRHLSQHNCNYCSSNGVRSNLCACYCRAEQKAQHDCTLVTGVSVVLEKMKVVKAQMID
jgi:hypothetical protein